MKLNVSSRELQFDRPSSDVISVDILFDGQRVWSIDLRKIESSVSITVSWPSPLMPYLKGASLVTLTDSGSNEILSSSEHQFTDEKVRTTVLDTSGNPLVINKWGRLGKTLERADGEIQDRILARSKEIITVLTDMGLRPFVVGGTLLGAVRENRLLPHDDDADIAYLSTYENPADVALEAFQVGRQLVELGYTLVRHSAAHMQLYFYSQDGQVDYYVDVFAAFFTDDGQINQPFHVRGETSVEQMLPFSQVTINGIGFPAPADTNHWLIINYDENWHTPIPGYQLDTPIQTQRRFKSWFGSFNGHRDFWNEFFSEGPIDRWRSGADWLMQQQRRLTAPTLIDLGSGTGALTHRIAIAQPGKRIIGLDYSAAAYTQSIRDESLENLEFGHINLLRLKSLSVASLFKIQGRFDVIANHLLEQVVHGARSNAWRVIRQALRSGGNAVATVYTQHAPDVSFHDPTGWHLSPAAIQNEAAQFGITCTFVSFDESGTQSASRAPIGIFFALGDSTHTITPKKEAMKNRLKRFVKRALKRPAVAEYETLENRVAELEADLDELRRNSLRVTELIDLAEQSFTHAELPSAADITNEKGIPND